MGFSRELSAPPQVSLPHAFGVIIRRGGKGEKGRHQLSGRKEKEGVGKGDPLFSHWGEKKVSLDVGVPKKSCSSREVKRRESRDGGGRTEDWEEEEEEDSELN